MRVLHMTLKKKWFDMITDPNPDKRKTEEYREIKPYWAKRLLADDLRLNPYFFVHFRNGYSKSSPWVVVQYLGVEIGEGKPEWGAPSDEVFIIKLGKIVEQYP